jgi:ferritin-like metal-binding protein YciE
MKENNEGFEKLYTDEIADIYDAEQQILKALPKMIQAASSTELKQALEEHRSATQGQVKRLDQIFSELGEHPSKKCKGMAGLLAEGEEVLKEDFEPMVKDAAIIAAAQRVEHYEIAAYGTARTFASYLGHDKAVKLLQQTLDEEKDADRLLTELAYSSVNLGAMSETGDDEDEGDREEEAEDGQEETTVGRSGNSRTARSTPPRSQRAPARGGRSPRSKAGT